MNELKVGQRIEVYNCIENGLNHRGVNIGDTYVGRPVMALGLVNILSETPRDGRVAFYPMCSSEVKKIGAFVVKRLHNTQPETII